jgi:hypothetical protein
VYDAISIEERNLPTVTLVNAGFLNDARSASSSKGWPGVRIVPTMVPCESSVTEDIESGVNSAMDAIVGALTQPLSQEEKAPESIETENPSRIIFRGDLEEVNRFYYKRGWTDGLPIIPPTESAVKEMVSGTDLPVSHLVGKLLPRLGKATIEKIAINAVMAGCLPTHLPVLIAAVEILADPRSRFGTFAQSTGSWSPCWIINGPIRKNLNINSGSGALSPGDIANATIGRALGLIIKNLGGIRKGVEDMGVLGNPGKYSLVIAENEEENPWEPLHVERGFQKEESTIALSYPNCYVQVWPYSSDDEGIMRAIIYNLTSGAGFTLLLTPPHARTLFRQGWSKKDIKASIAAYSRVPPFKLGSYWGMSKGPRKSPASNGQIGSYGAKIPAKEMEEFPIIQGPEEIQIIVAGGPGAFIGQLAGGTDSSDGMITKIRLPANWDALVQKYQNVVPIYTKY